jgi:PAS domain S-box-containing protein
MDINIEQVAFEDIVDLGELKSLLEKFSAITGFTTGLVDNTTNEALLGAGWRDICVNFHRTCPDSEKHCVSSNKELISDLNHSGDIRIHHCKNGLVDGCTPIIIQGRHFANLFSGQILFSPPDKEQFRKQAEQYGYNEQEYLQSLSEVPVISEKKFTAILHYLAEIASIIAQMGLANLQIRQQSTEREALLQSILKSAPVGIGLVINRVMDWTNDRMSEITGYTKAELKGQKAQMLYTDEVEFERVGQEKYAQIRDYGTGSVDTQLKRKDGSIIDVHLSSTPIDKKDLTAGVTFTVLDITERKKAEREIIKTKEDLFQAHKMEAIGTLAGGVAHDFNNILSAIIGFSELAKDSIPPDNPAQQDIDTILASSMRAADLVQQILTFGRKSTHHRHPFMPHLIVREALKMLRSSLPVTLSFEENIDADCGSILADPTKMHQIVVNLCTNAFHAMKNEKGLLAVSLYREEICAEDIHESDVSPGSFIVLSVGDTGCGMDSKTVERIFEPYFTLKETGKGSGLGLSVVHGIVKDYKGFIRVGSDPGKGSVFYVHLPALEKTVSSEGKNGKEIPTGTERILVVDDEISIANLQKTVLERLGYTVTAKTDSREALEEIRSDSDRLDLIITDQSMPYLSGVELAEEILKIKSDLKIILCTGYSSVITEEGALAIGIKKYLKKPINRSTLANVVRQVLDGDE